MIIVPKACRKEIEDLPEEVRGDLADALARLDAGLVLSMPLSRPMPSIGRGVHEGATAERSVWNVSDRVRTDPDWHRPRASRLQEDDHYNAGQEPGLGHEAP